MLVTGPAGSLPALEEGVRFWGTELLLPLGFRAEPDLPHSAIRRAAGATSDELAVLDDEGIEIIPRAIFKPLSRAAVRLMLLGERGAPLWEPPDDIFTGRALSPDPGFLLPVDRRTAVGTLWRSGRVPRGTLCRAHVCFRPEIALFLEGFRGSDGGVPAFGHVLHLLYLIGLGDRSGADPSQSANCLKRIAGRFRAEGCPLRNAGALCAAISAEVPARPMPRSWPRFTRS